MQRTASHATAVSLHRYVLSAVIHSISSKDIVMLIVPCLLERLGQAQGPSVENASLSPLHHWRLCLRQPPPPCLDFYALNKFLPSFLLLSFSFPFSTSLLISFHLFFSSLIPSISPSFLVSSYRSNRWTPLAIHHFLGCHPSDSCACVQTPY